MARVGQARVMPRNLYGEIQINHEKIHVVISSRYKGSVWGDTDKP